MKISDIRVLGPKNGYISYIEVEAEDGQVGIGSTSAPPPVVRALIEHGTPSMRSLVVGEEPRDPTKIWWKLFTRWQARVGRGAEGGMAVNAMGAIDMAIWDLAGKIQDKTICQLLGGALRDQLMAYASATYYVIGLDTMPNDLEWVKKDRELLRTGRETVGSDVKLLVDANQAYRPKQAVQVIKAIEEFDVEFVEQPIAAWDFEGLAYVRNHVDTPIMPHESLYDIQDAKRLIAMGAVDLLGLKLDRPGGLTNARVAYKIAELFDIPCTVISSVELGISTSAAMMFAASLKTLEYASEASGMMTISDDVVREPLVIKDGFAEVPTGIGLGAELDEQKIEKYSEGAITCS